MDRPYRQARRIGIVACLVGALGVSTSSAPQSSQPPQVFRSGADLVYVDVYPRKADRVVEGLTAENFQITEDGKPQTVQTFEFIQFEPSPPDAERRDPNTAADGERQAADPKNRVFVIYLDQFHTTRQGARDSAQPVLDFLTRTIGATDLFAVSGPESPLGRLTFGRRTDTLEGELQSHRDWGVADEQRPIVPRNAIEERLTQCAFQSFQGDDQLVEQTMLISREDRTYSSLEALIDRLGSLRDERKNLVMLSQGWLPQRDWPELANTSPTPSLPFVGVSPGGRITTTEPRTRTGVTDTWCRGELARLGRINFSDRFRDLVASAERNNVSVSSVNVGGLGTGMMPIDQSNAGGIGPGVIRNTRFPVASLEVLKTLAGATDGYVANTNDISAGFRKLSDRLNGYYLLGYYSTNTATDGKFRRIDVKVSQPGVAIAARRGYRAASAAEMAAVPPPLVVTPALEAVNAELGTLSRIGSERESFSLGVLRGDGVDVIVELAARELERGRWGSGASLAVTVTGAPGAPAEASAKIEAGRRGAVVHVPLAGAPTTPLHVRVRITGDQAPVDDRFDVSPDASGNSGLLGASVTFRGTASLRSILQPVGEFLFHRNERLHAEWPVLKPLDQRTARVLDRKGQPIGSALAMTERPADGGPPIASVDLPIAALADGDYLIEVTAASGAETERKLIAFRVAR